MGESVSYKIYNPELGMYSKGGTKLYDLWSKHGKTWATLSALRQHFAILKEYNKVPGQVYGNCEVVILRSQESRSPIGLYL